MIKHYDEIPCLVDIETRQEIIDYGAERLQEGDVAVELGCFLGGTLCRFVSQVKDVEVFAIDNWAFENISDESFNWANLDRQANYYEAFMKNLSDLELTDINVIVSDTAKAADQFEDGTVNYLFMDAAHGYGGVREEIKAWLPKMNGRCLMAIHDFSTACIANAVQDEFGQVQGTTSNGHTGILINTLHEEPGHYDI